MSQTSGTFLRYRHAVPARTWTRHATSDALVRVIVRVLFHRSYWPTSSSRSWRTSGHARTTVRARTAWLCLGLNHSVHSARRPTCSDVVEEGGQVDEDDESVLEGPVEVREDGLPPIHGKEGLGRGE